MSAAYAWPQAHAGQQQQLQPLQHANGLNSGTVSRGLRATAGQPEPSFIQLQSPTPQATPQAPHCGRTLVPWASPVAAALHAAASAGRLLIAPPAVPAVSATAQVPEAIAEASGGHAQAANANGGHAHAANASGGHAQAANASGGHEQAGNANGAFASPVACFSACQVPQFEAALPESAKRQQQQLAVAYPAAMLSALQQNGGAHFNAYSAVHAATPASAATGRVSGLETQAGSWAGRIDLLARVQAGTTLREHEQLQAHANELPALVAAHQQLREPQWKHQQQLQAAQAAQWNCAQQENLPAPAIAAAADVRVWPAMEGAAEKSNGHASIEALVTPRCAESPAAGAAGAVPNNGWAASASAGALLSPQMEAATIIASFGGGLGSGQLGAAGGPRGSDSVASAPGMRRYSYASRVHWGADVPASPASPATAQERPARMVYKAPDSHNTKLAVTTLGGAGSGAAVHSSTNAELAVYMAHLRAALRVTQSRKATQLMRVTAANAAVSSAAAALAAVADPGALPDVTQFYRRRHAGAAAALAAEEEELARVAVDAVRLTNAIATVAARMAVVTPAPPQQAQLPAQAADGTSTPSGCAASSPPALSAAATAAQFTPLHTQADAPAEAPTRDPAMAMGAFTPVQAAQRDSAAAAMVTTSTAAAAETPAHGPCSLRTSVVSVSAVARNRGRGRIPSTRTYGMPRVAGRVMTSASSDSASIMVPPVRSRSRSGERAARRQLRLSLDAAAATPSSELGSGLGSAGDAGRRFSVDGVLGRDTDRADELLSFASGPEDMAALLGRAHAGDNSEVQLQLAQLLCTVSRGEGGFAANGLVSPPSSSALVNARAGSTAATPSAGPTPLWEPTTVPSSLWEGSAAAAASRLALPAALPSAPGGSSAASRITPASGLPLAPSARRGRRMSLLADELEALGSGATLASTAVPSGLTRWLSPAPGADATSAATGGGAAATAAAVGPLSVQIVEADTADGMFPASAAGSSVRATGRKRRALTPTPTAATVGVAPRVGRVVSPEPTRAATSSDGGEGAPAAGSPAADLSALMAATADAACTADSCAHEGRLSKRRRMVDAPGPSTVAGAVACAAITAGKVGWRSLRGTGVTEPVGDRA
jgi:hypothetical protein